MLLLPHLYELLLGPFGIGLVCWFMVVLWLGAERRVKSLSLLLAVTAIVLGIAAAGAFEMSAKRYLPNRDLPLLTSGLFLTFALAAFVNGTVAFALIAPSLREQLRKR